ncbi:MAG: phospholipase D-like domain-containing protein [Planctomycetota bacterium]
MKKKKAVGLAIALTAISTFVAVSMFSGAKSINHTLQVDYSVRDPQFARALGGLLGPGVLSGNEVAGYQNGVEIFPPMLAAIRGAEQSITFETYIYWSGDIGREFAEALSARARAGVRVHVLLDWAGSGKMDDALLQVMTDAGVEIEKYHPITWHTLDRINNRTHRKILVVDGKVAFTGGVGIADQWGGDADSPEHWRDAHFRVSGPAAAQMQTAFMENWLELRPLVLHDPRYFPAIEPVGKAQAQVYSSSPDGGSSNMRLLYLLAIAAAKDTIHLANSYFVPDDVSVEALSVAARRGVKIKIIVPGPIMDAKIVQKASRSRWGELLEAGIAIYEYQPTMLHTKVMIVDSHFISVGSTNFDDRSFRLNDETNLNIMDGEFARQQVEVFQADVRASHLVTLEEWKNRPRREKVTEWLAKLVRRQL